MSGVREPRVRTGWAVAAALFSAVAVTVELSTRICAGNLFDPLPDGGAIAAYLFLAAALVFNEVALGAWTRPDAPQRDRTGRFKIRKENLWLLPAAFIASSGALAVAASYTAIFGPILPVSVIGLLVMGVGACAWSPLLNLCVLVVQFRALRARSRSLGRPFAPPVIAGAVAYGLLVLFGLVVRPLVLGYHIEQAIRDPARREASVGTLRLLHGEPLVLALAYDHAVPAWVNLGRTLHSGEMEPGSSFDTRKLYFLVTGRPYESASPPRSFNRANFWAASDPVLEEQGGELVGRAVKGLSLDSSRIDAVLDPRAETAYCEWTFRFRNASSAPQEARMELLLPPGGVVDKASLWINGEERQAAFGARGAAREAYQEVAVVERHDPLLVTTRAPGQVMAQCYPVPAGGTLQVRLGLSAPLVWTDPASPRLCFAPPSFRQVSFAMPARLRHEIWLEGHWPAEQERLEGAGWRIADAPAPEGHAESSRTHTARAELGSREILAPPCLTIAGGPPPRAGTVLAPELSRVRSPFAGPERAVDLSVVLDTSSSMRGALTPEALRSLTAALAALPAGSHVRYVDARDLARGEPGGSPWMEPRRLASLNRWCRSRRYEGGLEPGPLLARAWEEASLRENPSAILWLHGPVPEDFGDPAGLTACLRRRAAGPALVGVLCRPGPDSLLREVARFPRVHSLGLWQSPDAMADAVRIAGTAAERRSGDSLPLGGREPAINGTYVTQEEPTEIQRLSVAPVDSANAPAEARQIPPSSRLAAASRIMQTWYRVRQWSRPLEEAQRVALRRRLVTPLSGAVVLETKAQYDRHGLSDAAATSTIPSLPEPGPLALLGLAAGMAAVAWRRSRRRPGPAREGGA